jgi:hypothetical protein
MVTRTPSPANGRTNTRALADCWAKSTVRSASGSQTKFRLRRRHEVAQLPQHLGDPGAFGDGGVGAGEQLVLGGQGGDGRGLRDRGRVERHVHLAQRDDHLRVGDRVADPQPGQAVGLRKRAQHNDIAVLAGQPRLSGTRPSRMYST